MAFASNADEAGLAQKRVEGSFMMPTTDDRSEQLPAGVATKKPRRRPLFSRQRVVTKLWRTAERQVAEIETRIAGLDGDPAALERDAKTLAIIAKTVRDLVALDGEAASLPDRNTMKERAESHGSRPAKTDAASLEAHGDTEFGPRDIAGFRAELARRLDELRQEREGNSTS